MRRYFSHFLSATLLTLWTGTAAYGADINEARAHYVSGAYDQAIKTALALETAPGYTLAAEAMSAKVMLGYTDDANDDAKDARDWAKDALEIDPTSQEAQMQYALARGFETRTSSPFRAWRKKLPQKTLETIQAYRKTYPDDARGDALLGAWHLGIVRKTGEKNGEKWFGAKEIDGVKYYQSAYEAAPNDVVIASNFAVTLLSVNQEKYIDRARNILAAVSKMPTRNSVDEEIKGRMGALEPLFDNPEALQETVDELLDGNLPEAWDDVNDTGSDDDKGRDRDEDRDSDED